jgi:hypothetical protein
MAMRSNTLKHYASLSAKAIRLTLKGRLLEQVRLSRHYKLLAGSELFDQAFYLSQSPQLQHPNADLLGHYLTAGGFQGLDPNPLFDSDWYLERNPDVRVTGINPLLHFIQNGAREGRKPHPLFDPAGYSCPDSNVGAERALAHYLNQGGLQGCKPHILFDGKWYLDRYPDVSTSQLNPLVHYLESGWREGRDPHSLFHTAFYLERNPDVAKARLNPLIHFIETGFREDRDPNPLFDLHYYKARYSDVMETGVNALEHYVTSGAGERRQPHPLFDPGYYLDNVSPSEIAGTALQHYFCEGVQRGLSPHPLFDVRFYLDQQPWSKDLITDPVQHYLDFGASVGLDPCELFDTSYYVERYPEVAASGVNPLVHYLLSGTEKGYNPNPLFDTAFYFQRYPDVAAHNENPLIHYMRTGAFEGRAPSPFFDSLFYLQKNPGLRRARINPLAHYLRYGASGESGDPNPFFDNASYLNDHIELREQALNPLVHFLSASTESLRSEGEDQGLTELAANVTFKCRCLGILDPLKGSQIKLAQVICVTHVRPAAPKAGNEYRINRLLHRLRSDGYDVITIVSPLPIHSVSDEQIIELAEELGNAVLCERNGLVSFYTTEDHARVLRSIEGELVPDMRRVLAEPEQGLSKRELQSLTVDRTFCHDALIHLVTQMTAAQESCVVLAEYVFMSRMLPLLKQSVLRIIDTHDVFSSKSDKVLAFGVQDPLSLTAEEERERLARADLILAIQEDERQTLASLVESSDKVITVGVDFTVSSDFGRHSTAPLVLCVASDNWVNAHSVQQFLRLVWPSIVKAEPTAQILIAGGVSKSLRGTHEGVVMLGTVDDLNGLYRESRVVVNPALAGTGLKIKTLEALSRFVPVVTWPSGVEGMHPRLASKCLIAKDWFEFGQKVTGVLLQPECNDFLNEDRTEIRELLSPENAYRELERRLAISLRQPELTQA